MSPSASCIPQALLPSPGLAPPVRLARLVFFFSPSLVYLVFKPGFCANHSNSKPFSSVFISKYHGWLCYLLTIASFLKVVSSTPNLSRSGWMTISRSTSIHLPAIPQTRYLQNRPLYILHRCRLGFPRMYFSFNSTIGSGTLNLGFILKDFDLKDSLRKSSIIPADIPQSRTLHFSGGLPLCK